MCVVWERRQKSWGVDRACQLSHRNYISANEKKKLHAHALDTRNNFHIQNFSHFFFHWMCVFFALASTNGDNHDGFNQRQKYIYFHFFSHSACSRSRSATHIISHRAAARQKMDGGNIQCHSESAQRKNEDGKILQVVWRKKSESFPSSFFFSRNSNLNCTAFTSANTIRNFQFT